jgi:dolichol-phosphate mannosyltransferase
MVSTVACSPRSEVAESAFDVSVIVPTFREAENLPILVPRVAAALQAAGLTGEIVIVDDNSQDGTDAVCTRLAETYPLRLIVRKKERGLSGAVVTGLQHARGAVLLVMDADLSHPPEAIPQLVEPLRTNQADFTIGSRYVAGGATDDDWGLFRWLNSKVATLLARPLTSARDPMAGFFALRAESFEQAQALNPIGYKIGLELMVKCHCRRVHETPIHFRDRLHGTSKLSIKEQVNYLRHLGRLYAYQLTTAPRPLRFMLVGASGMAIDVLAYSVLLLLAPLPAARALAIWLAMTWNFWLNRRFTFETVKDASTFRQYIAFCLSCLLGAGVNWTVSVGLCRAAPVFREHAVLAAMLGVAAGFVFNYLTCCWLVFRTPQGTTSRSHEPSNPSRTDGANAV